MSLASVQDLRRIAESVGKLTDRTVRNVTVRSDCRQLRVTLDDGQVLLVSTLLDEEGRPRLDVDVFRGSTEGPDENQLEVSFDPASGE